LGTPSHSEQTIATAWALALRELREQAPDAEDLLTLCAVLAPDDVPLALLEHHSDQLPERLGATIRDRLACARQPAYWAATLWPLPLLIGH
jgi:hypothetical protein